jgi:hypothetical protein
MADAYIPRFRAERAVVPGTYDPLRRPGSSGQRYFSDMQYANPNMPQRIFDPEAEGYETQAAYDARFNTARDAATDAARAANTTQVAGLQADNLANLARQQRPAAQTLTDEEVIKTFTDIQNNPAYNTERKQIGQSVGAMNRYNVSPERASSLMNVPLSDVNEMMGPYYRAFGEAKPEGIANLLSKQTELVSEASRRLPVGMTPAQRSVTGALNDAPNDMVAKLLNMGIFTPETAAQFYQSRYPGLTAEQVQEALGQYGFAQGGLASVAPQGQGYYLGGPTDGMADQIPATIDNRQPAALSDGEFVIPADVVSHLGNGNSNSGAQHLYGMMDKVRKARTGNPEQGRQIDANKFLA